MTQSMTLVPMTADPITVLSRDIRKSAQTMSREEARYLVKMYYQIQDYRIQAAGQERSQDEGNEPHATVTWLAENMRKLENNIKSALNAYSDAHVVGVWAKTQLGIGPVIAAGLIAHINPEKTRTAGAVWKFAGQDPTAVWNKKEKRPWNAELKVLCWKIGESFVKVSNKEDSLYGRIYKERKEWETAKNERGENAETAKKILEDKKFNKATEAYKWYSEGKLPPAHIHARAKRVAVKLFLSHYCHVNWQSTTGEVPPLPYAINILGHADHIPPPNWPMAEKPKKKSKDAEDLED